MVVCGHPAWPDEHAAPALHTLIAMQPDVEVLNALSVVDDNPQVLDDQSSLGSAKQYTPQIDFAMYVTRIECVWTEVDSRWFCHAYRATPHVCEPERDAADDEGEERYAQADRGYQDKSSVNSAHIIQNGIGRVTQTQAALPVRARILIPVSLPCALRLGL
jgi:hypothetical protein